MDLPRSATEIRPNGSAEGGAFLPVSAQAMQEQVRAIQALMKSVMREGEHYGQVPGSRKPSLWKAGAEKLSVAFHIAPSFVIEDLSSPEHSRYRVCCVGRHQVSGIRLGEGFGSCSSMESRYKWRRASDEEFERTPKSRRRLKYGYDREKNRHYEVKQVRAEHEDIENTVLKMACKRAHVAMVLNVTAASDIFTQDLEELPEFVEERAGEPALAPIREPARKVANSEEGIKPPPSPDASSPLSAGQRRVLKAHLKHSGVAEDALTKKFGVRVSELSRSHFREACAWIRGVESSPQVPTEAQP